MWIYTLCNVRLSMYIVYVCFFVCILVFFFNSLTSFLSFLFPPCTVHRHRTRLCFFTHYAPQCAPVVLPPGQHESPPSPFQHNNRNPVVFYCWTAGSYFPPISFLPSYWLFFFFFFTRSMLYYLFFFSSEIFWSLCFLFPRKILLLLCNI